MSSPTTKTDIERKRLQNRNAQQTYKKSILKRLEELEKQQELLRGNVRTNDHETSSKEFKIYGTSVSPRMEPSASPPLQLGAYDKPSCQSPTLTLPSHDFAKASPCLTFPDLHNWSEFSQPEEKMDLRGMTPVSMPSSPGLNRNSRHSFPLLFSPVDFHQYPEMLSSTNLSEHESTHYSRAASLSHSPRQSTPLHKAVEQGHEGIVRILVLHQANIHALNAEGRTALHIAVERDHRAIVCCLLDAGSNLDIPDFQGRLPLEIAIASENEELVQLLLSRGADVNIAVITHQRSD